MFLGISDPGIIGAILLIVLSTGLCIGYGLKNWNSDK